ncbi:ABC transporter ATP-binding protein [Acuticoccus sp.]|uniref:ABC transporter ATP-binding protein n=1 Tax=Acuticoccus sp. TaxID=1904378 RepID=UPI003B52559B
MVREDLCGDGAQRPVGGEAQRARSAERERTAERSGTPPDRTPALTFGPIVAALAELYRRLRPTRRRQLAALSVLVVAGALAEVVTIAAIVPFLALLVGLDKLPANPVTDVLADLAGSDPGSLVVVAGAVLAVAVVVTALFQLALSIATKVLTYRIGHEVSVEIYARTLNQPYARFIERNTSEVLASVDKIHAVVIGVILPALQAITAMAVATGILVVLLVIEPVVAACAIVFLVPTYGGLMLLTRPRLMRASRVLSRTYGARIKAVQEGLGGIRDIKIDRSQARFIDDFRRTDGEFRGAQIEAAVIAEAPRRLVESVGIAVIVVAAVVISLEGGQAATALPVAGAMAYGFRRLMPLFQDVYQARSAFSTYSGLLVDVLAMMDTPEEPAGEADAAPLPFDEALVCRAVTFTYRGAARPALDRIDLRIPQGARIGFVGRSGAGKSTLVDVLMGLLEPDAGTILVDGVALDGASRTRWQACIAHVPQSIYLADDTVAANIAFGARGGPLDLARVEAAAREAEVHGFVSSLPDGYATRVGERGVRLSGGQRQRIGIARALYRRPTLLILDEATSALDDATEAAIMRSIERLGRDITILAIAHRVTTLSACDRLYRLEAGRIAFAGDYDALLAERQAEGAA